MMDKYAHIIDLPHHVSKYRLQMTMYQRAAQFAPFAALTGHSAAISETTNEREESGACSGYPERGGGRRSQTARLTDKAMELSESECEVLNQKITLLLAHLDEHPYVCITYFVPDLQKEGGKYVTHSGSIKSWDEYEQKITFDDNTQVKANEIIDIKGELFM